MYFTRTKVLINRDFSLQVGERNTCDQTLPNKSRSAVRVTADRNGEQEIFFSVVHNRILNS